MNSNKHLSLWSDGIYRQDTGNATLQKGISDMFERANAEIYLALKWENEEMKKELDRKQNKVMVATV